MRNPNYTEYFEAFKAELAEDTCNGYLIPYHDQIIREWDWWLTVHKPQTKAMWEALPEDERPRAMWAGTFRSGGKAWKALRSIKNKYRAQARVDAAEDRRKAGWLGPNTYRIAPDGRKYTNTGYRFSRYAQPDDWKYL